MGSSQRHFSNAVSRMALRLVRERAGDDGVERMLDLAGETRSREELEDFTSWSSYTETRALLEAAGIVLGGSQAFRSIASCWTRDEGASELLALLQSLGSPAEILRSIAKASAKFSTVVAFEPVDIAPDRGTVAARGSEQFPRFRELCDYTAGLLSIGPLLFGLPPATVLEDRCQVRGDEECRFQVMWVNNADDLHGRIEHLSAELAALGARFESLRGTVADLVTTGDVEHVLAKITARAADAVRAPGYLLAVALSEDGPLHVEHRGLDETRIDTIVAEVMANVADDCRGSRLIVEVASPRRHYGRLAALYPAGVEFFAEERAMLNAYAGLAAVALDVATSLSEVQRQAEEARAQARTASGLLDLAGRLSGAVGRDEVVQRLAEAVPRVIDCDRCSVLLFDEHAQVLRLTALHGYPEDVAASVKDLEVNLDDKVLKLRDHEGFMFFTPDAGDGKVPEVLRKTGTEALVVVPLVAGGRFYGVASAGVTSDPSRLAPRPELVERLQGIADQAAIALQNADLIDQVRYQALHDGLTGLANRRLLEDRIDQALARARRTGEHVAVLFCDVDRFKNVNDSLGHGAGNEVLRAVGRRLLDMLRDEDTVARVGGDEFVIVLGGDCDRSDARRTAEKLLVACREPLPNGVLVTMSVGVAVAPDDGLDTETLLRNADTAMYDAKAEGRATVRLHSPAPPTPYTKLSLEADLRRAVANGELLVHFQPQLELDTSRVVGVEALVRWRHPELGTIPPSDFLPLAEESDLITEIDRWVIAESVALQARLATRGMRVRVAINLCDRDLRDPTLPSDVEALVRRHCLKPEDIELELTERIAAEGGQRFERALSRLSEIGVRLAVDDFGTGSSSLSRLAEWRFDTLKIDRSFVAPITSPYDHAPLVTAVIALGHSLGLDVLAEGVETEAQREFLANHGCDLAQGFLFSRPVEAAEIERLVASDLAARQATPAS